MIKPYFVLLLLYLVSCKEKSSIKYNVPSNESISNSDSTSKVRNKYKSISEIVNEQSSVWAKVEDTTASVALHFQYKDTLLVSYSMECYFLYPYTVDRKKITVYWDDNIDTKYEFDLVKTVGKIDKKFIGKPFMFLELTADTMLKATYLEKDLIRTLNNASTERLFFPTSYRLMQPGEYYY